jgi:hypothetical protein
LLAVVSALALLIYLHHWQVALAVGVIVGSVMGWKFWKKKDAEVSIVSWIARIMNKDLNDFLQIKVKPVSPEPFDLTAYVQSKANLNIAIHGTSRLGKTSLGEYLCLKLPERKIVISFKKFLPNKRDFDIGYLWIDVSKLVPNLYADSQSFTEAFRTAFFADLSMKGLMIDTILAKVRDVMLEKPNNFETFYKILDKVAGRGNWEESIKIIIKSKVQLLQRATEGAKHGNIDFSNGNIVLDLGNLPDEESKTFLAEYYLRQIARIEEREQREEKLCIVIDEAWHLLRSTQQMSKVGELLLQGAYYIHFLCITQNYTHLDEDYRGHFGNIFCFQNANDKDIIAIKNAYPDGLIWEGLGQIEPFTFIDLMYYHKKEGVLVWKLNYEKLKNLKLQTKTSSALHEPDESFVEEEPKEVKKDVEEENLEEKITEVLQESNVAMYGYQIAKAVGLSPKDAVKVRQPLRQLDGKLESDELQLRKKIIIYYCIHGSEQFHNLMMREAEKEIVNAGWKVVFKSNHGTHGYDFLIEKEGKQVIVEVETSKRHTLGEFEKRVAEYDKPVLIVNPTPKEKERYEYLPSAQNGKTKIVIIPEITEVLDIWQ